MAAASTWSSIPCSRRQIRLDVVLQCGQSFIWRENARGEWLGVLCGRVWRLKQDDTHVYYQVYSRETSPSHSDKETKFLPEEDSKDHLMDVQTFSQAQQTKSSPQSKSIKQESQATSSKAMSEDTKVPRIKSEPQETDYDSLLAAILQDYLQLTVDTDKLYQQWSDVDPYFKKTASDFWGVRMLRQDPVENLFSIICTTNNQLTRIPDMVEKLCVHYGEPIAEVDGRMYHSFPTIAALAEPGVEENLKELGFGYRAAYIATSATYIVDNHGEEWVSLLRHYSYEKAKTELMKLHGVGPKVADCVCLMSLDKPEAIPVDTHVRQFAANHYLPELQSIKSVTNKVYKEIADHFRDLWGPYAGWAQAVLFAAELPQMQSKKSSACQDSKHKKQP